MINGFLSRSRLIANCVYVHFIELGLCFEAKPILAQLIIYFSTTSNVVRSNVVNFKDAGLLLLPLQACAHRFQFTFNYEKSTRWQQTWIRAKVIKYWASLGEYEVNCPLSGGSTHISANLRMCVRCCGRLLASFFSFSNSKLTKIQLCFLHTLGGSVGANVLHVPADAQSEWDVYKITLPRRGECLHNYCHSQLPALHEAAIECERLMSFRIPCNELSIINSSQ